MEILKVTSKEKDLIESIRNYKTAYPNGAVALEWYIMNLLDELLEID